MPVKMVGMNLSDAPSAEELLAQLGIPAASADELLALLGDSRPTPPPPPVSPAARIGGVVSKLGETPGSGYARPHSSYHVSPEVAGRSHAGFAEAVGAGGAAASSSAAKVAAQAGGAGAKAAAGVGAKDAGKSLLSTALKYGGKGVGLLGKLNPVLGPIFTAWMIYDMARAGYDFVNGDPDEEIARKSLALDMMGEAGQRAMDGSPADTEALLRRLVRQSARQEALQGYSQAQMSGEVEKLVEGKRAKLAQMSVLARPSLAEVYADMGLIGG